MTESSVRMPRRLASCILLLGSLTYPAAAQQSADSTSEPATHLMQMLEALTSTGQLVIEQRQIGAANLMREFTAPGDSSRRGPTRGTSTTLSPASRAPGATA